MLITWWQPMVKMWAQMQGMSERLKNSVQIKEKWNLNNK